MMRLSKALHCVRPITEFVAEHAARKIYQPHNAMNNDRGSKRGTASA